MSFAPNRTDDRDLRLQLFFFKKKEVIAVVGKSLVYYGKGIGVTR